ncbi:MAG: leucine-rich repeat protein [Clostridiales bacterium]|jgi:uncharacterized repeat protein (TIGR02543 family)|nr:leucine-rich repeat protein [Clostridiales bacterium]
MKKRTASLTLILLILVVAAGMPITSFASNGTDFITKVTDEGVTITGYTGSGGDIIIPSAINGLPVAAISPGAFYDIASITGVTIPGSVSVIGGSAFDNCTNLAKVTISSGVKSVGQGAFRGCTSLTSVVIPDGVLDIGEQAFFECTRLLEVVLPDSIVSIGIRALGTEENTQVYVPNEAIKRLAENSGAKNVVSGNICAVVFEMNGGRKIDSTFGVNGQRIPQPLSPKKRGHSFAGWYRDAGFTTAWNFQADVLAGNITLYAKWSAITPAPVGTSHNPVSIVQDAGHDIGYYNSWYKSAYGHVPAVMTVVNDDGTVSVLSAAIGLPHLYVYEYTWDMQYIRTVAINKELPDDKGYSSVGAFTKDHAGTYYIFYGKNVEEDAHNEINMILAQYNSDGQKLRQYERAAFYGTSGGVKRPFNSSPCRIEISGNSIVTYFGRELFKNENGVNHQASYGFILHLDSFTEIPAKVYADMTYASHSFNQFVLPIDGGFIIANQGDASPRAFTFTNTLSGRGLTSFDFVGEYGENATFAQMGGLAKTSSGYIFAGAYERGRVTSPMYTLQDSAMSRNMFIVKFDDNMVKCSEPIWITDYTNAETQNVAHPKIVELDEGRYILMWEYSKGSDGTGQAENTAASPVYYTVIDENGDTLTPITELPGVKLSSDDVLRYNPKTCSVQWAVGGTERTGDANLFTIYSFNPNAPLSASVSKINE